MPAAIRTGLIAPQSWLGTVAVLVVPIGFLALWVAYGPSQIADGVPGLAVGWALAVSGLLASIVAPWSRIGVLLVGAGLAWFIPIFPAV